jgi:hypothetical protein
MSNSLPKPSALQPKMLKWGLGICTAVYILAFPLLLSMAFVCSMLAFERPTETPLTIGVMSCVPLSIPVSIYLAWSRYFRNRLNKALVFAGFPVYVFIVMLIICGLLDAL